MANTPSSRQQKSSGNVPIWLVIVIVLMLLCSVASIVAVYQSSGRANEFMAELLPTQAAIAVAPSLTLNPEGMPNEPSATPSWTPPPSRTPYITPTFVNTAQAPVSNTRTIVGNISAGNNQLIIGSNSGEAVIVPTVTAAIPRSTQTSVAATATQAVTQTRVAATATGIADTIATATSIAYTATPIPGSWRVDFYNNRNLQDPIVAVANASMSTLNDLALYFDWGTDSPLPGVVNADEFSARFRSNANFSNVNYLFYAFSDDGVRVNVSGDTIIDQWTSASNRVLYSNKLMSAGYNPIQVEYFEGGGDARVAFGWQVRLSNHWIAEYFDNENFDQPPFLIDQDDAINEEWVSPAPTNVSVRWFKDYDFGSTARQYRFQVTVDDAVTVKVGGNVVLEANSPGTYVETSTLSGTQEVVVEYVQRSGNARIQFDITPITSSTSTPTPTNTPTPTPSPTPTNTPTWTPTPANTATGTPTPTVMATATP